MNASEQIMVHGASGHTGRFVVDELLRLGLTPVLAGRDRARLQMVATAHAARLEHRAFDLADPGSTKDALEGVVVVLNCAGPFLDTALPLARAAVAGSAHYLDVTAEQAAVQSLYRELDGPAREAGVAVIPGMAFYGGLADLMVTAALDGATDAIAITVATGLDHWWPTPGTRATGARNTAPRLVVRNGLPAPVEPEEIPSSWDFPEPFGRQPVAPMPLSEIITIDRHIRVRDLRSYINTIPLIELDDTGTPPPRAVDDQGRSDQRFVVDVGID